MAAPSSSPMLYEQLWIQLLAQNFSGIREIWNDFKTSTYENNTSIKGAATDTKEGLFLTLSRPAIEAFLTTPRTVSTGVFTQRSYTPLQYAARYGCLECMKFFIDLLDDRKRKIFLNQSNEQGETLLHIAARYGFASVVAYLLQNNVSITSDIDGNTPLHIAAKYNRKEIVNMLKTRIPTGALNLSGKTALDLSKNEDVKTALRINHNAKTTGRMSVEIDLNKEQAKRSASQCYVMHFIKQRLQALEAESNTLSFYNYYDLKVKSAKQGHLQTLLALINASPSVQFNFKTVLKNYALSHPKEYAAMIQGGFFAWGSKRTYHMMKNLMHETPPPQIRERDAAIMSLQQRLKTLEDELTEKSSIGKGTKENKINAILKLINHLQDPLYYSSSVKDAIVRFERDKQEEYKALIAGLPNNDTLALVTRLKDNYGTTQNIPTCLDYETKSSNTIEMSFG